MFEVKIYIETSLKGPHPHGESPGWYAAVAEYQTKKHGIQTREDFGYKEYTTYHETVLLGLLKSLKRLNTACILEIHTDSTYLINNCENGSLKRWQTNDWKNSKGEEVKNKRLWQRVSGELDRHQVTFIWERRSEYSKWLMKEAGKIAEASKTRIKMLRNGLNPE